MAALSIPDATTAAPAAQAAPPTIAQPMDLSGTVAVVATFQSRDNFTNEYRYHITVRNLGADPLIGESLRLVLDRVTNVGGDDREALKSETLLSRMEILDADGQTEDGKPYFRIATDGTSDLMPRADSLPVVVRLRNRDYVQVFTPVFRVVGARRPPPVARRRHRRAVEYGGDSGVRSGDRAGGWKSRGAETGARQIDPAVD